MNKAAIAIGTWFGCGYFPIASGTVGSAAAIGIAWLFTLNGNAAPWWFALAAALLTPVGVWAAEVTARSVSSKDPSIVVVDEVLGQWLALAGAASLNWKTLTCAFFLFRLFDIWKPQPARKLESLPGGVGIVADDLMAGFYAALVLWLAGWFNLL